jgi:hypothetical protein
MFFSAEINWASLEIQAQQGDFFSLFFTGLDFFAYFFHRWKKVRPSRRAKLPEKIKCMSFEQKLQLSLRFNL